MNRADPEIFWFSTAAQPMTSSIFQRPFKLRISTSTQLQWGRSQAEPIFDNNL